LFHVRKNLIKYILIFLSVSSILPANGKLDILLEKIKYQPDTLKIKTLDEYCFKYRSNDNKFALQCGETALVLARKLSDKHLEAKTLNLLGVIHRGIGNLEKALTLSIDALTAAEECKDSTEIAYACNNIGGVYRLKAFYSLALNYIIKGLTIFEHYNNKMGMSYCTINIGFIYLRQHNYKKALEYYNLTYKLRDEINDKRGKIIALRAIAEIYTAMNNYKAALENYLELEKECTAEGEMAELSATWQGEGLIRMKKHDYTHAIIYLKRSLDLAVKLNAVETQIAGRGYLGVAYAYLGRYSEAYNVLSQSLNQAKRFKDSYLVLECYTDFSKYFEIQKDYKQSLYFSKLYSTLRNSLISQENINAVNEQEAIYKNEKGKRENSILQKDILLAETQRDYLILIAFLLIVITSVIYGRYHFKKIANRKLNELNATKDKLFKIIAHDLKNPFLAIFGYSEMLIHDYNDLTDKERLEFILNIDKSSRQTYRLVENLLFWAQSQTGKLEFNPKTINLNNLITQTVTLLQPLANNKNIKLGIESSEELNVQCDEEMMKTILRNLIVNGIKFTNSGGEINIKAKNYDHHTEIIVEDNGVGIDNDKLSNLFSIENPESSLGTAGEKGTGLGLILCKEFIEKHGGIIRVESIPNKGSKFIFTVPFLNKN
jgi:signal transduction histidine kinase